MRALKLDKSAFPEIGNCHASHTLVSSDLVSIIVTSSKSTVIFSAL